MSLPRISIITPSFNQGKFLRETILSVITQDYPDLEYMVIDGGSTDNSADIIRRYESKINFWVSEKDTGQSQAINKGLRRSTGEIIGWLNSDDLYCKDTLARVAAFFRDHPDVSMLHGKTILFDGKKETEKGAEDFDLDLRYFSVMPFAQPSSFFRRKIIDEQGLLDEHLHYGMDYDLLIRTALNYKIEKSDEIFSKYRLHNESKTISQLENFTFDWAKVFSKFLRSVDKEEKWITLLKNIDLYFSGEDTFSSSRSFTAGDLKLIFLYFLEYQLHICYELLNREKAQKIGNMIQQIDKAFYRQRKLAKINWRISNLSPAVIKLIRKISR